MRWAMILCIVPLSAQQQPLPFSHKLHTERRVKCQDCHPNPDPGRAMTLPTAKKCAACHQTQEVAWVRIYKLPEWVTWSHRPHLKSVVKCDACHGDVAQMDVISLATNVTKMTGCLDCHRQKKATLECNSCHDLN